MNKLIKLSLLATLSSVLFTGCQNMSATEQSIGAAALGGALGGGVGSNVGGTTGAVLGAGAGGAVASKVDGGSNKNAVYSGVGDAIMTRVD